MQSNEKPSDLPFELNEEDRKAFFICRQMQYSVSFFSCFQCSSFEITKGALHCGYCKFPKEASPESQAVTAAFYKQSCGEAREDKDGQKTKKTKSKGKLEAAIAFLKETPSRSKLYEHLAGFGISKAYMISLYSSAVKKIPGYKETDAATKKGKKVAGSSAVPIKDVAVSFLKEHSSKSELVAFLIQKGVSPNYASTLYYTAKREIKNYTEKDETAKKGKKGKGVANEKRAMAVELLQKGLDKDKVVERLVKKLAISEAYAAVLYYQAKSELKLPNKKRVKKVKTEKKS